MAIISVYKGIVETHVFLTKNEKWINSNYFLKFSNILMKLERNTTMAKSLWMCVQKILIPDNFPGIKGNPDFQGMIN